MKRMQTLLLCCISLCYSVAVSKSKFSETVKETEASNDISTMTSSDEADYFDTINSVLRNVSNDNWPRDVLYTLASAATSLLSPNGYTQDLIWTYVNSRDATENVSGPKLKLMLHYLTRRNHLKLKNEDISITLLSELNKEATPSNISTNEGCITAHADHYYVGRIWSDKALTAGKYDLFNLYPKTTATRSRGKSAESRSTLTDDTIASSVSSIAGNNAKGQIARRIFYLDTRYGFNIRGHSGLSIPSELLTTLLTWHSEFPVSKHELQLSSKIYDIQQSINPYVLAPALVSRVYACDHRSRGAVLLSKDVRNFISLLKVTENDKCGNTVLSEARNALNRMKLRLVSSPPTIEENEEDNTSRKWTSYTFNKEFKPRRRHSDRGAKTSSAEDEKCRLSKSKASCIPSSRCVIVKSRKEGNTCIKREIN